MPTWDKLTIINEALVNTSSDPIETANDGSDEWVAGSSAYEQHLPILLSRRDWKFAEQLFTLNRVGDSTLPGYTDVFAKPSNCINLVSVWRSDDIVIPYPGYDADIAATVRVPFLMYEIVADQIHTNAPNGATAKALVLPVGAQPWSATFVAALRLNIEVVLLRSLNQDFPEANARQRLAEEALREAIWLADREEPSRPRFRSKLAERRRRRGYGGYSP